MKLTIETIQIPMMSGEAKPCEVKTFEIEGHIFSVRKINDGLCYVVHRVTGLKVTAEHTGDMAEAAEGFCIAVQVGAYNLTGVEAAAAKSPALNGSPIGWCAA